MFLAMQWWADETFTVMDRRRPTQSAIRQALGHRGEWCDAALAARRSRVADPAR